jgi:hypothetical protein
MSTRLRFHCMEENMMRFLIPFITASLVATTAPAEAQAATRRDKSLIRGPVVVYYDTSGSHAPFLTEDADRNGHPDYVDSIAIYAEEFWKDVVAGLQVAAPAFDRGRHPAYPIFLEDLSASGFTEWGYNQTETYPNSFVSIENDYRYGQADSTVTYQPNGSVTAYDKITLFRNPYCILKGVVYHELMHGVQRNYVTNAELGRIWSERIPTWIENRILYPRNRLVHAVPFSIATKESFINSTSSSAKYGNGRFLTLLEQMAGPAAVMEVFTARKRWVDSLGLSAVDDPAQELRFFKAILARHALSWTEFLSRYSAELAHMFANSGNGHAAPAGGLFPVEKAFFNVGNGPENLLAMSLPQAETLGPLRLRVVSLPSVILKPNTPVDLACPIGKCHVTLFRSMVDSTSFSTLVADANNPIRMILPPLGYIEAFILTGEDSTRVEFTQGVTAVAQGRPATKLRGVWSPGQIVAEGLPAGRRARLRAWNMRGQLVLDAELVGGPRSAWYRPLGEGPLQARLTLLD